MLYVIKNGAVVLLITFVFCLLFHTVVFADAIFNNGDVNNDGVINTSDVLTLLPSWSSGVGQGDQYGDGKVNSLDFTIVTKSLGTNLSLCTKKGEYTIAIRLLNGQGEFCNTSTNQLFIPRGNSYFEVVKNGAIDPWTGTPVDAGLPLGIGLYDPAKV